MGEVAILLSQNKLEKEALGLTRDIVKKFPDSFEGWRYISQLPGSTEEEKTFAKKAYSIIHAFENLNANRIIWIDADTITIQPIDINLLLMKSYQKDQTMSLKLLGKKIIFFLIKFQKY
jgi:hypothetical protein